MYGGDRDHATICAVSTPPGRGGISVVRLSGGNSLKIARQLCPFIPEHPESHKLYFGRFLDPIHQHIIDEGLVSYFKTGHSYTGEECLEFSCHGNPQITSELIRSLCDCGAYVAGPGEFTYRAFLNGKIDLVQAENVLALIEGRTDLQRRVALKNLKGQLSDQVLNIEEGLIKMLALLEISIDFIEEDIEIVDFDTLEREASGILKQLGDLMGSFAGGQLVTEGLDIALIGPPNAGKSSLLNALVKEDRAIVTDEPGTTRDVVTAELNIGGILTRISDTAGLRDTESMVEKLGIDRSKSVAQVSDLVFYVFDVSEGFSDSDLEVLRSLSQTSTLCLVGNKSDRLAAEESQNYWDSSALRGFFPKADYFLGSCRDGDLSSTLIDYLQTRFVNNLDMDQAMVTSGRQYELLKQAMEYCQVSISQMKGRVSADLISAELKHCLISVQELAGRQFDDQILDRIFKDFCIGK